HRSYLLHFLYDIFIMRRHQLTAVIPIRLIAIVFLGVVTGRTNDPTLAMKLPDSKAQFRGRTERLKKKYFYSIGCEYISSGFCKKTAVVATIMRDGDPDLSARKGFLQIIGITLRSHP